MLFFLGGKPNRYIKKPKSYAEAKRRIPDHGTTIEGIYDCSQGKENREGSGIVNVDALPNGRVEREGVQTAGSDRPEPTPSQSTKTSSFPSKRSCVKNVLQTRWGESRSDLKVRCSLRTSFLAQSKGGMQGPQNRQLKKRRIEESGVAKGRRSQGQDYEHA